MSTPAPSPTVRVVLVLDVPTDSAALLRRAVELADEFGIMMTRLLPGVQAQKATVAPSNTRTAVAAQPPEPGLLVDVPHRLVTIDGSPIRLAHREFELLKYLAVIAGRAASRTELMHNVWGDVTGRSLPAAGPISERTVDTHVQRVRAKLGSHGRSVVTVRGRGYRFEPSLDTRIVLSRSTSQTG